MKKLSKNIFDLFKKKLENQIKEPNNYTDIIEKAKNEKVQAQSFEYENLEWKLPFLSSILRDTHWESNITDEQRIKYIKQGILDNSNLETIWKERIELIKPDYGVFMYGSKADFPINCRCICFEYQNLNVEQYIRICIDLSNGTPYLSDEQAAYYGASMGTTYKQKRIDWDDFLNIAKKISEEVFNHYSGINDKNWRNYLKANVVEFCLY